MHIKLKWQNDDSLRWLVRTRGRVKHALLWPHALIAIEILCYTTLYKACSTTSTSHHQKQRQNTNRKITRCHCGLKDRLLNCMITFFAIQLMADIHTAFFLLSSLPLSGHCRRHALLADPQSGTVPSYQHTLTSQQPSSYMPTYTLQGCKSMCTCANKPLSQERVRTLQQLYSWDFLFTVNHRLTCTLRSLQKVAPIDTHISETVSHLDGSISWPTH